MIQNTGYNKNEVMYDSPQRHSSYGLLLCFLFREFCFVTSSGFAGGALTLALSIVGGFASDVDVLCDNAPGLDGVVGAVAEKADALSTSTLSDGLTGAVRGPAS